MALTAIPPARAEILCDPALAGPGLSYAANLPNATQFVDTVLALGSEFGPGNTLGVMDVDNTLLAMLDDLGSDQWYRWQRTLLASPGADAGEVAADFDGMLTCSGFSSAPGPCA